MVVSSFAFADERGWNVTRRIYRLVGRGFRPLRSGELRVRRLTTLKEFRGAALTVFDSCTISRPKHAALANAHR
jgi:hypothetical protein